MLRYWLAAVIAVVGVGAGLTVGLTAYRDPEPASGRPLIASGTAKPVGSQTLNRPGIGDCSGVPRAAPVVPAVVVTALQPGKTRQPGQAEQADLAVP